MSFVPSRAVASVRTGRFSCLRHAIEIQIMAESTAAPRGRKLLNALNSFGSRMGMPSMSAGRSRPLGSRRQSCGMSAWPTKWISA